jgi:SAM-dependent methyltransferase
MDRYALFERILARQHTPVTGVLLDFGCGSGELVKAAVEKGVDAYGCDIDFSSEWVNQSVLAQMMAQGRVRKVEMRTSGKESPGAGDAYRLPFEDGMFDVVISDQVLEHVHNYAEVVRELHRVMKPGAVFLHMFPARYRLVEAHVLVPLAGFYRPHWWLSMWAAIGIRNREFQRDWSAARTAAANAEWLPAMTNYLTVRELKREFSPLFAIKFVEGEFMAASKRAKVFLLPSLYRLLQSRIMYGVRE